NEEARVDIALGIGNESGADMLIQDGFEVVEIAIEHDPSRTFDAEDVSAGHLVVAEFLQRINGSVAVEEPVAATVERNAILVVGVKRGKCAAYQLVKVAGVFANFRRHRVVNKAGAKR